MSDEEKPFACSQPDCGMQFTNEDHLAVHMRKHDMSLALNLAAGGLSPLGLFTDQTPTPTKFLKNCEELGLFSELSKNPFDDSFKKAMDDPLDHSLNLPGTEGADLDTPQPPIPKIVIGGEEIHENRKLQDKPKDLSMSSIVPKKRKFLTQILPTSTTSEDEEEAVIGSSSTELNGSSENIVSNSVPVEVSSSISVQSPQNVIHIAEKLQSPQNIVHITEKLHSPQNVIHITDEGLRSPENGTELQESFRSPQSVANIVDSFQSSQVTESSPGSVNDQILSPRSVGSVGNDNVLIINEKTITSSSPVISNTTTGVINLTSVPASTVTVQQKTVAAAPSSPMMVQVLLQLPGGQVVPVQVPAANVATSQPVVPKPQPKPQQIQLVKPVVQPQPAIANLTQNSPTMFLAGNTLFQTGQNVQTVTPGGIIQNTLNTVPFTVQSPQQQQQKTIPQTGLQTILNQSGTHSTIQAMLNQAATQSALRTILVANKQTGLQSTTPQLQPAQMIQNAIIENQTTSKPQQKVTVPGSQSYTKQRLKAAIQQQTTPGNQKLFHSGDVKNEPQWSPGTNVSSPEAGLSPGTSTMTYEQLMSDYPSDNNDVKREKFLERNRAAAARCRQKRKHWVQTLESKADNLSNVNNKLCGEIKKLRGEVASLKTLLMAHKDCPVTMQQRAQGQLGNEMFALGSDLNDITPINIGDCADTLTVSENSVINNHLSTSTSGDQSISSLPVGLSMIQSIGDQVVFKPVSVFTGANSLGLIPKIVNIDQSIQKTSSGS